MPKKFNDEEIHQVLDYHNEGKSIREISKMVNLSRPSISKIVNGEISSGNLSTDIFMSQKEAENLPEINHNSEVIHPENEEENQVLEVESMTASIDYGNLDNLIHKEYNEPPQDKPVNKQPVNKPPVNKPPKLPKPKPVKKPPAPKPQKMTKAEMKFIDTEIKGDLITKIYKLINLFPHYYEDFHDGNISKYINTLKKKSIEDLSITYNLFDNIRKNNIALNQCNSMFRIGSKTIETLATFRGYNCVGLTDDVISMKEYDEIMRDLAVKYQDKLQTKPEVRLLMLYGSTLMMKVKMNKMISMNKQEQDKEEIHEKKEQSLSEIQKEFEDI